MEEYEKRLMRGELLKATRLQNEGIALQNDVFSRAAKELERNIKARNEGDMTYYFDDVEYSLLSLVCEPINSFSSKGYDFIRVTALFVRRDVEATGTIEGVKPTQREAILIGRIKDVVDKIRKECRKERMMAYCDELDDLQGNNWRGLRSLKNGIKAIEDMRWELYREDILKERFFTMRLSTGKDGYGNTALI